MRLDGVKEVETDIRRNEVTVTFDDTKVSFDDMAEILTKKHFPPKGEPRYLK
jgi:copper chaperone CopZ